MKKMRFLAVLVIAVLTTMSVKAQEFSVSADVVSSYVWRGVQYSGVSIQPTLDFTTGGFSIGSWGSAGFDGFLEQDLYTKYAFDFGLSLGVTDYFYPGAASNWFSGDSHAFEANLGYGIENFSLSANYIFAGGGSVGNDLYFELGYAFDKFSIFAGAGNGWHTSTGDFGVVNVGISTSKEIKVTDSFSIPVKASAILNPTTKQYFLVAGITL